MYMNCAQVLAHMHSGKNIPKLATLSQICQTTKLIPHQIFYTTDTNSVCVRGGGGGGGKASLFLHLWYICISHLTLFAQVIIIFP